MEKMTRININDFVYIQITKDGWKHLKETVEPSYITHSILPNKKKITYESFVLDGDYYKFALWEVFSLFPPIHGGKTLFKTNILISSES